MSHLTRRSFIAAAAAVPLAGTATRRRPDDDDFDPREKATRHNLPCEETVLLRLRDVLAALEGLPQAHGPDCDCEPCEECYHFAHFVQSSESIVEGRLYSSPRLRARRKERYPELSAEDRLMFGFLDAQEAIAAVHQAHGAECPCSFCADLEHLRWFLASQTSVLSSMGLGSIAWLKRRYGKELFALNEDGQRHSGADAATGERRAARP